VKTAREVANDPHLEARGYWVDIDHPRRGRTRVPISAIRLHAGGKPEIRSPAPTLGQHTEKVLAELLGLKAAELRRAARPARHRAGDGAEGLGLAGR
jgi:crotonobetainyl-CoA:carnitine CoA-transferase CaiB-like acyl-CoA transferase